MSGTVISMLDAVVPLLAQSLFCCTVMLTLTAASVALARRSSAAVRHRWWSLGLLGAIAFPAIVPVLPSLAHSWRPLWTAEGANRFRQGSTPESPVVGAAVPTDRTNQQQLENHGIDSQAVVAPATLSQDTTMSDAKRQVWFARAPHVIAVIWLTGVVLALIRQALIEVRARMFVRRAHRYSCPISQELANRLSGLLGLRGVPRIFASPAATVPLTAGWLRPVVILPVGAADWNPDRVRIALAHELAHIARRDVMWQSLARIACACYWPHPLIWIASWRLRVESEHACDDAVLQLGEPPAEYAAHLIEVAAIASGPTTWAPAIVAMASRSRVEQRVTSILEAGVPRTPVSRLSGVALWVATVLGVLATGSVRPVISQTAPEVSTDRETNSNTESAESTTTTTFDGVVLDPYKQPLADAHVRLYESFTFEEVFFAETRTDSNGRFSIEEFPTERAGRWYCKLIVSSPTFATRVITPATTEVDGENLSHLEIALSVPASLRGRVVGPDFKPVSGADVFAPPFKSPVPGAHSAKTDVNGYFQIPDLQPWDSGEADVAAVAATVARNGSFVSGLSKGLRVRHPEFGNGGVGYTKVPSTVFMRFDRPMVISGRVLHAGTRKPLADVPVAGGSMQTTTNRDGRYRLLVQHRDEQIEIEPQRRDWTGNTISIKVTPGAKAEVDDILIQPAE